MISFAIRDPRSAIRDPRSAIRFRNQIDALECRPYDSPSRAGQVWLGGA